MRVILFGATGMVGRSVLRECLLDEQVKEVLAIGRAPTGQSNAKLRELVRADMFDVAGIADDELRDYDACFFCLGVSSVGMKEAEYTRLTYDLTLAWARLLARLNPKMAFLYVSGTGTGGKAMWAQVKGRTENALLELFPSAYMIRIGAVRAKHGEAPRRGWGRYLYAALGPVLLPLIGLLAPGSVITSEELGRAMIRAVRDGAPKRILENRDLRKMGAKA